jgi:hypothetical protein
MESRSNKKIVADAVKQSGFAIRYACVKLRNDEEIALIAVKSK